MLHDGAPAGRFLLAAPVRAPRPADADLRGAVEAHDLARHARRAPSGALVVVLEDTGARFAAPVVQRATREDANERALARVDVACGGRRGARAGARKEGRKSKRMSARVAGVGAAWDGGGVVGGSETHR